MVDSLLQLFTSHPEIAFIISIVISIIIALLGVIPSVFITAANILFFGFWNGMFISFLGESIGAGIAFLLYRSGFKKKIGDSLNRYPTVEKLVNAKGQDAFFLILALRLIPFIPSGLITFAAAIGRIAFLKFMVASSVGKMPALFIEAYAVNAVTAFNWQGKLILTITALVILIQIIVKRK